MNVWLDKERYVWMNSSGFLAMDRMPGPAQWN